MVAVTAKIFFKEEGIEEGKKILKELVEKTNEEEGCIEYRAYVSNENKLDIVIMEKWESNAHLDAHAKTKHFTELLPKLGPFTSKEPEIVTYSELF